MKNYPAATAQKMSDGSYLVRVFHAYDRSTDVTFPLDSENERLALEYANFKIAQRLSGPQSPATAAVIADAKASEDPNDLHERLVATAMLTPEEQEIDA